MRVAIDVSPLSGGHRVRGVGFYLQNLKNALVKYFPENDYFFFEDIKTIPKDFEIVHFPYFEPFFLSLRILPNKKNVVTIHDLTPIIFNDHFPAGLKGGLKWQIQKRRLKMTNAIITDSESSKKDIEKIVGTDVKTYKVYLAAAPDFKELKNSQGAPRGLPDRFLLYVGDATWNKNLPRIVDAVRQTDQTLVMVGKALGSETYNQSSNSWNSDLNSVLKLTRDDPRFIKLGFISSSDLNLLYNNALALVMPSIYEGFGLPILEAMQAGCPVITSTEGSIPEVADEAVLYVDCYDTKSIKEGILRVVKNKTLRKELSGKGLMRSKLFSWQKTAEETLRVYEEVDSKY